MSTRKATEKHEALYQELIAVLGKHDLNPEEMLAVIANLVGKLIAWQDQSKYTSAQVLKVVTQNIELGNQQVIEQMLSNPIKGRA